MRGERISMSRQSGRTTIAAHIACRLAPGRLQTPGLWGCHPREHDCRRAHHHPSQNRPCGPGGNPPGRNCSGAWGAPPSRWSGAGVDAVGDMWPTGIVGTGCHRNQSSSVERRTRRPWPHRGGGAPGSAAAAPGRRCPGVECPGDVL